jgi:hypothetical protein
LNPRAHGLSYKMGAKKHGKWFNPAITVKDGQMSVPNGAVPAV